MKYYLLRFWFFVLTVFLFVPGALFAQSFSAERVEQYLEVENLDRADSYLQSVLDKDPSHEQALGYMIDISNQRDDQQALYRYYRRLANRPPEEFETYAPEDVYYHTGILAYQRGEYDRSIRYFNRAQRQLGPGQHTRHERMQGWILRARSAQERLQKQQRSKRRKRIADSLAQLIANQEWDQASKFLEEQTESIEKDSFLQSLEDTLALFRTIRSWHQFTISIPDTSSRGELTQKIRQAQKWLDETGVEQFSRYDQNTRQSLQDSYNKISQQWIHTGLIRLLQHLGSLHLEQGNYREALEPLLRAHELSSEPRTETLRPLTRTYYQLGEYQDARHYFSLWDRYASGEQIEHSLGWKIWLFDRGPWLGTILSGIVGLFIGGWFLIRRYAGDALTTLGEYLGDRFEERNWTKLAYGTYWFFCDESDLSRPALNRYITVSRKLGQRDRMEQLLETGQQQDKLYPDQVVEWGRILLERDDPRAQEILESALSDWSALSSRARAGLARDLSQEYLEIGQTDRAYQLSLRLLKEIDDDPELYQRVTRLAAKLGKWDQWENRAKEWFDRVSGTHEQPSRQRNYGETEDPKRYATRSEVATKLLDQYGRYRSVPLAQEDTSRLFTLTDWLEETTHEAVSQIEVLEELFSRNLSSEQSKEVGLELARNYKSSGDLDSMVSLLESLRDSHPEDLETLTLLSQQYVELDQRKSAYEVLLKLLELQKDNVPARNQLERMGRRYEDEQEYVSAERFYRAILEHSSFQKPEIELRLGTVLYKQGEVEQALSVFQGISQGKTSLQAKIVSFIVRCLVELDMPEAAIERISKLDLDDGAIPAETRRSLYYWRARAQENRGNIEGALGSYRQIMASDVDFRDVSQRVSLMESKTSTPRPEE